MPQRRASRSTSIGDTPSAPAVVSDVASAGSSRTRTRYSRMTEAQDIPDNGVLLTVVDAPNRRLKDSGLSSANPFGCHSGYSSTYRSYLTQRQAAKLSEISQQGRIEAERSKLRDEAAQVIGEAFGLTSNAVRVNLFKDLPDSVTPEAASQLLHSEWPPLRDRLFVVAAKYPIGEFFALTVQFVAVITLLLEALCAVMQHRDDEDGGFGELAGSIPRLASQASKAGTRLIAAIQVNTVPPQWAEWPDFEQLLRPADENR
jgi:hypothetical protein